jgi:hypothetical protein
MVQENDDCSLCQGLTLLADKVPDPINSPGITCSMLDNYYRFAWTGPSTPNTTVISQGICRADAGYNFNSELCCMASVPIYECEQNIHKMLLGDNALNPYNSAVPPILSIDQPLNVSVSILYQALEHIDVEEGTATLFLDIVLQWNDPRLKWDVVDFDTCSNVINVFTGMLLLRHIINSRCESQRSS